MFTGIVACKVPIVAITDQATAKQLSLTKPTDWQLTIGESITVDGICSTVIETDQSSFRVHYMEETLAKTMIGQKVVGQSVNLERSLKLQDLMSGHMVSGHIDMTGSVTAIESLPGSRVIRFSYPAAFSRYLITKGSIAVNGVSLTVVSVEPESFTVALIPHTLEVTNLGELTVGEPVNLEFDMLAKYLERLMEPAQQPQK